MEERFDNYDAFVEYAKKYQLEYQKKDFTAKTMVVAGVAVGWLLSPLVAAPLAVCGLVKNTKIKEEIKEQQYRCLTLAMYMDDLQSFLEE